MKRDSILMHPLPRNEEIEIGCDSNFRSKYFDQIEMVFKLEWLC